MAQRGREAMNKRAREKARQERQEAKRQKRADRAGQTDGPPAHDEAALMEEFRRLSEMHAAKQVSESRYLEERRRIMTALGIEPDQEG